MRYKLIIFDADGTLRRALSNPVSPSSPDDWKLLPNVKTVIDFKRANSGAFKVQFGIAANQGGVHFGYVTKEDALQALLLLAKELGVPEGAVRMCTSMEPADPRRKPNPGMLREIAEYYGVSSPEEILYVGDMEIDSECAERFRCAFSYAKNFFGW